MTDPEKPSDRLARELNDALARPLPWWARVKAWASRLRSRSATMGGYWGGITMWDRWRKR